MKNIDIREEIKAAGLKQWRVADACGISEESFSKKLRYELTEQEKKKIREAIKIAKAGEAHA